MQTTIKILQLSHQLKKDGTIPIVIRITQNRTSKYIKTGYSVTEGQFKEGFGNWVSKHPDSALINAALETKRSALMDSVIKADIEGADIDINLLAGKKGASGKTVFGVITNLMQTYEHRLQVASFNRIKTNLGYLKEAWGKDILLTELNKYWVEKYANFRFAKGNGAATVKKNLMDLGVAINNADYEGKNFFSAYAKTIHSTPIKREKLTGEEIKALELANLDGLVEVARDMFLFSFYCHGMRFESVATFTVKMIQGNKIVYRMNKGKKMREIEIHTKLEKLITKYKAGKTLFLFPVVKRTPEVWTKKEIIGSANVLINTYLNRAAVLAGIERHIHFHIARHSFANLSLNRGVSYSILKDALGHSSFQMTQIYLNSLSDKAVDEAVRGLYD